MIAPDVKTHVAISQAGEKFENKMFFHGFASALQERNALQCNARSIQLNASDVKTISGK